MKTTLDDLLITEPPTTDESPARATARVTYRFTVCGQQRTFTVEATVSGSAAEAALNLINAGYEDARAWLRTKTPTRTPQAPATTPATGLRGGLRGGLLGRRRVTVVVDRAEPAAELVHGFVAATVEVGAVVHEYTGDVATAGNPFRATNAALASAKNDLWNWAWDQKTAR